MYHDILVQLKNAGRAKKENMQVPFSNLSFVILKLLADAGYAEDVQKRNVGKKSVIDVRLRYKDKAPVFTHFKLISKPGRRVYRGYRELSPVRQHTGISVLSTPDGVMTNREARKKKVGGEYLF